MGVSRWEWAIVSVIRLFPLKWEMNISLWLDNPLSIKHSPFRKLLANQPSILKDFRRANQTADGIQTLWALLRGTCSLYIMSVNTEDRSGAGHTWAMSWCLYLFTASLSVPRSVNPLITLRVRTMKRVFINEGPFGRGLENRLLSCDLWALRDSQSADSPLDESILINLYSFFFGP